MHSGIRGNEAKNADQHSEMAEMLPFRSNPKGAFDCQNAHQNPQEVTPPSQTTQPGTCMQSCSPSLELFDDRE